MHTITERLVLLAFDNRNRKLGEAADMRLGYGLCGALLCDLFDQQLLQSRRDGTFHVAPSAQPAHPLLQMVIERIPQGNITAEEILKHFHAAMDQIRKQVLDWVTEQGILRTKTNKLKWAFAVALHTLRPAAAGYRAALMGDLTKKRARPMDIQAVQVALAARLLENGVAKKWQSALEKAGIQKDWLLDVIEKTMPDTKPKKRKRPRSNDPVTWEWRGFWLDKAETRRKEKALYAAISAVGRAMRQDDTYLIVDGIGENIKWRNGMLEIKRPVEADGEYTAFAPKERYRFPLSADKAGRIFSQFSFSKPLKDITAFKRYLSQNGMHYTQIEVRKKRSRVKLHPLARVEFCTLSVEGRNYVSVCVESPEKELTTNYAKHFRTANVMAMGYVEFLRHCQMERAE